MAGGIKTRSRRNRRQNADINITPMVDVMLVLLVVFMIAAPLMTVGVNVDLPKTKAQQISTKREPLTITVQRSGQLYLQETKVTRSQLVRRLRVIAQRNANLRIFVRGDKSVKYGKVLDIMGQITNAGFKKVSLITEHDK